MHIIGLTGGFGSGKTTVAAMFARQGFPVIDADEITRELLAPGKKCVKKVAKVFPGVILKPLKVDRLALAKIVFNNPRELLKLTNILYPEALKVIKSQISQYKDEPFVILDVPLLFESKWDRITDTNIVVKARRADQIKRIQKRLKLSKSQIMSRIKNQMPLKEKCERADIVIDNSRDLKDTSLQVKAIIARLEKRTTRRNR
ncbi:MAG: dephospho-CoA kinase [Candidatus Omnitrophica bacterium]|nr:dephospho-CoA kinase [Candidatus Omnitrophota bacterium]